MRHKAQIIAGTKRKRLVGLSGGLSLAAAISGASLGDGASIHALGAQLLSAADSCDSVFVWSRVGWLDQSYKGALRQWDAAIPFPETHLLMTLNELGAQIRFDGPLELTVLGTKQAPRGTFDPAADQDLATFDTHGLYGFYYESSGRLSDPRVLVSSLSASLDSAIVRAVRMVNDSGSLLPLPATVANSSVELRLTIGTSVFSDSTAVTGALFRVRQPVLHGVTPPVGDRKLTLAPHYPDEERIAGMDGEVLVEVVVREDGTVDPGSILIAKATTASFAQHVYEAVVKSKFVPGRVGGCPVASLVARPYTFTIAR